MKITTESGLDIEVIPYDPVNDPEEVLLKEFSFNDRLAAEVTPDDPRPSVELRLTFARRPSSENNFIRRLALHGETVIGRATVILPRREHPGYEENKHIAMVEVSVDRSYRRRGVAKVLLGEVSAILRGEPEVTSVLGSAWNEAGKKLCLKLGGKFSSEGAENKLVIAEVNWELIDEWERQGRELAAREGVELQFFEDCPESIIEEYTEIYQETMNQQPLGEFDGKIVETPESRRRKEREFREKGVKWYTYITVERNGEISGLTEMMYVPEMPVKAYQNLTGVREKYRGRGLGKWLKAHMLRWIVREHPEIKFITTGNDETNAPMLSINRRMGYKKNVGNTSYMFEKNKLIQLIEEI